MDERRLNIVLRPRDQEHMAICRLDTGETTAIGAIRAALREMARVAWPRVATGCTHYESNGACSANGCNCAQGNCPVLKEIA